MTTLTMTGAASTSRPGMAIPGRRIDRPYGAVGPVGASLAARLRRHLPREV